tara:strand:+ start:597 stop:1526 length:930 start_codon:yes stop_codon:yes gene_type:complete
MIIEPSAQHKLFGHTDIFNQFINLHLKNKLPNKILLSGQKGLGKSTLAYHLINYVLSKGENYTYNQNNCEINLKNKSYILLQNKSNPNINLIDVTKDKKNIDVDQIKKLILDLNKSSFNDKSRFVLIDNIEFLNNNSVNALLKLIEEPNDNINFILINNNKKISSTLKSRCLNFNISLTYEESIKIINKIINGNIFNLVNYELIDNYVTPGQILNILEFSKEHKIDVKDTNLKDFLSIIIKNKMYKKEKSIIDIIYSFIELYFRKRITLKNVNVLNFYSYFVKKINYTKTYNLDEEILFMEFDDKILNG